jgi:hypothetical protein
MLRIVKGQNVKKILKVGFLASIAGFVAYFVCSNFPAEYRELAQNGSLVLFAMGWGVSLSGLAFHLGWKSVRKD